MYLTVIFVTHVGKMEVPHFFHQVSTYKIVVWLIMSLFSTTSSLQFKLLCFGWSSTECYISHNIFSVHFKINAVFIYISVNVNCQLTEVMINIVFHYYLLRFGLYYVCFFVPSYVAILRIPYCKVYIYFYWIGK